MRVVGFVCCYTGAIRTRKATGTHSRYVEEGSYEHDLGYCKAENCANHPAARGIVDGLVDHEGKVSAAFIASAEK